MDPGTIIQGINLVGSLFNSNKGPSLAERKAQMAPFKQGLDNQLKRVNEYRDMGSSFYDQMKQQLMNTMMNSVDLSNTVGNRANYGASSTIQNQQNMDRMTKGIQGIPNQLNDAWMNMQRQSDQEYQNWLSGTQQYTQGIMGAWTEEHQAKQNQWDDISGMLGLLGDAFPSNKKDKNKEEED